LTLANNHTLDHGETGLVETLEHLSAAKIVSLGAGHDVKEARRGVVFQLRQTRVGVLNYLEDSFMDSLYLRSFAWGDRPGCARLDAASLRRDLARMRGHADVVLVVVHWGRNYEGVTASQRIYGRLAIDYGADAVVGHHPHVHQPVALHRGRPIVYSVGNYAFGTPGQAWLRYGLLARFEIEQKRLRRLILIPLFVQNRLIQFKPETLAGEEARTMLEGLIRESRELGTPLLLHGERAVLDLGAGS
jgi:poly-gamma-glutamate synthesis protein (capsule biosynthesis protein)